MQTIDSRTRLRNAYVGRIELVCSLPIPVSLCDGARSISYKYCGASELVHSDPTHNVATFYRLKIDSHTYVSRYVTVPRTQPLFILACHSIITVVIIVIFIFASCASMSLPYVWNNTAYLSCVSRGVYVRICVVYLLYEFMCYMR